MVANIIIAVSKYLFVEMLYLHIYLGSYKRFYIRTMDSTQKRFLFIIDSDFRLFPLRFYGV